MLKGEGKINRGPACPFLLNSHFPSSTFIMKKKTIEIKPAILVTLLMVYFLVGVLSGYLVDLKTQSELRFKDANIEGCNNLTLINTTECLVNFVKSVYKYNYTDDEIELTTEELFERGGDCKDWTELYQSLANTRGFQTKERRRNINQTFNQELNRNVSFDHMNLEIYDSTGYCIVDQVYYACFSY